ncbi:hypothetical protein [Micromonospora sp. CB01531]|uniref:hypothetical protein n=1 Tax=Micromonospora sp. CB01531 TaxID=1718947 RepID=UPI00093C20F7|nr:hypothetical protein [Micromonospora sp. CB01531]OKI47291.1 hypothetical protein A6A27_10615 [Micromonospora sp. CB01531]
MNTPANEPADAFYVLSVVKQTEGGVTSQMWAITAEQAEQVARDMGPASSEMFAPREAAEGLHDSAHAAGAVFMDVEP